MNNRICYNCDTKLDLCKCKCCNKCNKYLCKDCGYKCSSCLTYVCRDNICYKYVNNDCINSLFDYVPYMKLRPYIPSDLICENYIHVQNKNHNTLFLFFLQQQIPVIPDIIKIIISYI